MMKRLCLSLTLVFGFAAAASASPISIVHTGSGSGTLDGTAFGSLAPLAFTITATSDTTNIVSCGTTCWFADNTTASIDIAGVGVFSFITGTRYFVNNGFVGFSRAGAGGNDLFNGPSLGFSWDMTTSVGPVAGLASLLQWTNSPVNTSGGVLVFNSGNSSSLFTATVSTTPDVIPEPGTLALFGTGIAAFLARRRLLSAKK